MSKEQPDGRRGSQGHGCTLFTPVPGWLAEAEGQLLGDTEQEKQLGLRTVFIVFQSSESRLPGHQAEGCLVVWACTALMGGALFLREAGLSVVFLSKGTSHSCSWVPCPTMHTGSSSFQPTPGVPDARRAQGYQTAGGSSSGPGCQELAPLLKDLELGRRKERLFGSLLGLLSVLG